MKNSSKIKGIAALAIAVIGIIVMLAKSGIVGLLMYLIATAISVCSIGKENRGSISEITAYVKDTLQHISGETLLTNDIFAIIIALLPIVAIVGLFMFFYIDPIRAAEKAIDDAFTELDNLFN